MISFLIVFPNYILYAEEDIKIEKRKESSSTEKPDHNKWDLYTGIILGTNYTANSQYNAKGGFSPHVLLLVEYPFFKMSSVALEFGYLQRRWEITGRNNESIDVTTDFFNMQVNLRHRFEIDPVRPYLIFGLFLDTCLSGNFNSGGHEYDYAGDEYIDRVIFGMVWGIGSEYSFDKRGAFRIPTMAVIIPLS